MNFITGETPKTFTPSTKLFRLLLGKLSINVLFSASPAASYIIEIIRAVAANGDFLHIVGVPNRSKANRVTPPKFRQKAKGAYNLRLC